MNGRLIVIQGYLAAGKSTFARQLSKALNIPCFVKDTFKSALCESIELTSREESSRFSAVTFDGLLYIAERMLEAGQPLILEGNFTPPGVKKKDEAGALQALLRQYHCRPLTFRFTGDTHVLFERFIARENSPERGKANTMMTTFSQADFDGWCRNLDGFSLGGKTIEIDTTNFAAIDFEQYLTVARQFLNR